MLQIRSRWEKKWRVGDWHNGIPCLLPTAQAPLPPPRCMRTPGANVMSCYAAGVQLEEPPRVRDIPELDMARLRRSVHVAATASYQASGAGPGGTARPRPPAGPRGPTGSTARERRLGRTGRQEVVRAAAGGVTDAAARDCVFWVSGLDGCTCLLGSQGLCVVQPWQAVPQSRSLRRPPHHIYMEPHLRRCRG